MKQQTDSTNLISPSFHKGQRLNKLIKWVKQVNLTVSHVKQQIDNTNLINPSFHKGQTLNGLIKWVNLTMSHVKQQIDNTNPISPNFHNGQRLNGLISLTHHADVNNWNFGKYLKIEYVRNMIKLEEIIAKWHSPKHGFNLYVSQ